MAKSKKKSMMKQNPKKNKEIKFKLRNKIYIYENVNKIDNDGSWGYCSDPSESEKNRKIKVLKDLDGIDRFNTDIHEMTHGVLWDLDESVVEQISTDISKALWKLGYRKIESN